MLMLLRFYAGWLWQDIAAIDRLVLWPPTSKPDDPADFGRELYQRYLAHLLALRLWGYEWLGLLAAAILLVLLSSIFGRAPLAAGRRGLSNNRGASRTGGIELSPRRYACRRTGRTTGPTARLCVVCRQ